MDQVGKRNRGLLADKEMSVIRHAMNRQELLSAMGDDAGDVFVQLLFKFRSNETLSSFDGKDDLDIDLCVGVCHDADVGKFVVERANNLQRWESRGTPVGVACL